MYHKGLFLVNHRCTFTITITLTLQITNILEIAILVREIFVSKSAADVWRKRLVKWMRFLGAERRALLAVQCLHYLAVIVIAVVVLKVDPYRFLPSATATPPSESLGKSTLFLNATVRIIYWYPQEPHGVAQEWKVYDRVVVVLVDALRADMVSNRSEMRYLRSVISNSSGCKGAFVSAAQTPTVTMPRIKALVTGTVPNFIDVMNNIDSAALGGDHLVERFASSGREMVFYGDETWLKLFPRHFKRSDGTSSFFTKDFTVVDQNVSRHLPQEFDPLSQHPFSKDWDTVVLHYLGLDHIGHQHGPRSPHMADKLSEMDGVLHQIHSALLRQEVARKKKRPNALPTLLLLLSDHGMTKQGNHGGASSDETSAFLLLQHVGSEAEAQVKRQRPFQFMHVMQVDLAPTLGLLLGVGIPAQSVGTIIPQAFPEEFRARAFEANAKQLSTLLLAKGGTLSTQASTLLSEEKYEEFVYLAKETLIGSGASEVASLKEVAILFLAAGFMALPTALAICKARSVWSNLEYGVVVFGMVIHPLGFFSSSFIENEHAYWFHFVTTWLLVRAAWHVACQQHSSAARLLSVTLLLRVLRSRLQIINWALLNDTTDPPRTNDGTAVLMLPWYLSSRTTAVIAIALTCVLCVSLIQAYSRSFARRSFGSAAVITAGAAICCIKASIPGEGEVLIARVVFLSVFVLACLTLYTDSLKESFAFVYTALALLISLVHRTEHTVIISLVAGMTLLVTEYFNRTGASWGEIALVLCCVGQCAFFGLGNSHAIATMDISGAYTGLSEYVFVVVFFLTGIILFSSHLLPFAPLFSSRLKGSSTRELTHAMWAIVAWSCYRMWVVCVVLILMRSHLFIWTVFAPKWVYEFLSSLMVLVVSHALCPGW